MIGSHTFDEFIDMATLFHNYPAPGLLIGGYMVEEAKVHIPKGTLYEAISETSWCLPDAIQMLTPCTMGNGWMRIMNFGLYAMSLYDKYTGKGVRVWLDMDKIPEDSEIATWLLKLKPKKEQDSDRLRKEIGIFGSDIMSVRPITLRRRMLIKRSKGSITRCPVCGEAYPSQHGTICRSCRGESPYSVKQGQESPMVFPLPPEVTTMEVADAVGAQVVHDMTRIDPGVSKGAAFRKGQVLEAGDLCRLQQMGRNKIYVQESEHNSGFVHEDQCAMDFAHEMAGDGIVPGGPPHEGKVALKADVDGLLRVNTELLHAFNLCPGVMAASRNSWALVKKGTDVAATRAIPLYLERRLYDRAMAVLDDGPIFDLVPLRKAKVGVLITGDEVFNGQIEDRFEDIIRSKVTALDSHLHKTVIVPDNREAIRDAAKELLAHGSEVIITTAGLSVDPGDLTRYGLEDAGAYDLLYGAPILPGAMTLVGRIGQARLLGVPACALFFKTTSLDLLLPRLLADLDVTREDLAKLGEGGMCLGCSNCSFPKCPFGK
jgi:formylmethanofuran dehydrogenase subunit E